MGNNIKSSFDYELLYHLYLLRVYPYGVDRAYSALIEVEYQLLINTIFSRALMNIQTGRKAY